MEYSVKKDIAFEKRNGRIIKLLKGDKITSKDIDNDMMLGGFLKDKSIVKSKEKAEVNVELEAKVDEAKKGQE